MTGRDPSTRAGHTEMRSSGGPTWLIVYCSDYKCAHSGAISAERWPDGIRLSYLETDAIEVDVPAIWPRCGSNRRAGTVPQWQPAVLPPRPGLVAAVAAIRIQGRAGDG